MKTGDDFFAIWGGIAGCQSLLPAMLTRAHEHELPLPAIASLTSDAPARRLRLAGKGRIAPGYDADLALVELDSRYTLEEADLRYRHRLSPFVGSVFRGRVRRTIVRGQTVVCEGQPVGAARGRLLRPDSGHAG
jgi:allantoinase